MWFLPFFKNIIKEEFVYFIKKENFMGFFTSFKPPLKTEEFFSKITVASKLYPN